MNKEMRKGMRKGWKEEWRNLVTGSGRRRGSWDRKRGKQRSNMRI